MSCYVLAQLTFKDLPAYRRYQAEFADVMRQFKGRLLVADEAPRPLDGNWRADKIVLIWFPHEAAYAEWAASAAYQRIAVDRIAGADTRSLLLRGFADSPDLGARQVR